MRQGREFCGEDGGSYDSDVSALDDEIDDSAQILQRLSKLHESQMPTSSPTINGNAGLANTKTTSMHSEISHPGQNLEVTIPKKSEKKRKVSRKSEPQNTKSEGAGAGMANKTNGLAAKKKKPSKEAQGPTQGDGSETIPPGPTKSFSQSTPPIAGNNGSEMSKAKPDMKPALGGHTEAQTLANKSLSRKQKKQLRRRARRKELSSQSALDPKTEAQAHTNYLKANERDPHEHGHTINQTESEREEKSEQARAFDAELRGLLQSSNERQINLYDSGKLNKATKEVKDDIKDLKEERKYDEEVQQMSKSSERQRNSKGSVEKIPQNEEGKSTSGPSNNASTNMSNHQGLETSEKNKSREKVKSKRRPKSSKMVRPEEGKENTTGFQSPVIPSA